VISRKQPDPRAAAKRAALRALKKARRAADKEGVELSDWEGEFLGSVEERVQTYGRALPIRRRAGRGRRCRPCRRAS
jgi:hypothetical protein